MLSQIKTTFSLLCKYFIHPMFYNIQKQDMKRVHFASGIALSLFVSLHLINHLSALQSIATHIKIMKALRLIYQHPLIEPLLLLAIAVQIFSGIALVRQWGWRPTGGYSKLQVYSGLYLAFFLLMHTSATLFGRLVINIDTNFYFAAMVVNVKPHAFFYIPYYMLGVLSFFVHIACILRLKLIPSRGRSQATLGAQVIIGVGVLVALLIIIGLTYQVTLPSEYLNLIQ